MGSEQFVLRGTQISQTISKDETRDATLREEQILKLALGTDCSRAYTTHRHQSAEVERKRKEEWEEFVRKRKEKEAKRKQKEREEEKAFQAEMRERLRALGYAEETIDIMVDKEKTRKFKDKVNYESPHTTVRDNRRAPRRPVYPKVHKSYLSTETLKYYDLPWEYDRSDPDYIIILRDMDKRETDLLFEHTTRLRSGRLHTEH